MSVTTGIPVIMGANIGTSVTNTIISMYYVGDADYLERAHVRRRHRPRHVQHAHRGGAATDRGRLRCIVQLLRRGQAPGGREGQQVGGPAQEDRRPDHCRVPHRKQGRHEVCRAREVHVQGDLLDARGLLARFQHERVRLVLVLGPRRVLQATLAST
mmetsp:Transcript_20143/g.42429  ORF Transcript_20143/g.42429 Transcript_20143/m.42429 type:complete len:157 (-) Transcript_20143:218-688(-)